MTLFKGAIQLSVSHCRIGRLVFHYSSFSFTPQIFGSVYLAFRCCKSKSSPKPPPLGHSTWAWAWLMGLLVGVMTLGSFVAVQFVPVSHFVAISLAMPPATLILSRCCLG